MDIKKRCTKCRKFRPLVNRSWCGPCNRTYQRNWARTKNGTILRIDPAPSGMKTCWKCRSQQGNSKKYFPIRNGKTVSPCKTCIRALNKKDHRAQRQETLEMYGGKNPVCACCGEGTFEFLSIDHINGGGNKHRRQTGSVFHRWLKKNNFPPGFQILCHNCNLAKGYYGECPHKRVVKAVA